MYGHQLWRVLRSFNMVDIRFFNALNHVHTVSNLSSRLSRLVYSRITDYNFSRRWILYICIYNKNIKDFFDIKIVSLPSAGFIKGQFKSNTWRECEEIPLYFCRFVGILMHRCALSSQRSRDEVEFLRADFNARMKCLLFNSFSNTYYCVYIPASFSQVNIVFVWSLSTYLLPCCQIQVTRSIFVRRDFYISKTTGSRIISFLSGSRVFVYIWRVISHSSKPRCIQTSRCNISFAKSHLTYDFQLLRCLPSCCSAPGTVDQNSRQVCPVLRVRILNAQFTCSSLVIWFAFFFSSKFTVG